MERLGCVVFDEAHYFNDADRGEVWEYILVNLPKHINVVLLSATLPNVEHFANWLACTRERDLCLVIKNERIVPLTHYAFVEDTLYKIMDDENKMFGCIYYYGLLPSNLKD